MAQAHTQPQAVPLPESRFARFELDRILDYLGYVILIVYSGIAIFPVLLILLNSVKSRRAVFSSPYSLPNPLDFNGYNTVFARGNFVRYFGNSLFVTITVLFLVLVLGSMAAYGLSEYRFRGNALLAIFFSLGIMIPIRLGTVSLVRLMRTLELQGTLWSLIIVYTAMGLPLTIFILSGFMSEIPRDLKDAARVDGASEYRIYWMLVLPLVRPALATVAVFHMIPVWNDLWWPLVLAPAESTRTITLGVSEFVGQFKTDWSALLAALSIGMMPVLILYAVFSRQLIRGLTRGAVKQ